MKSFPKILLIAILFSNSYFVFSQKTSELGFMLGGTHYQGDINTSNLIKSPSFSIGILFRHNFSTRYSLRANIIRAKLTANDVNSQYQYQQLRGANFATTIYDLTAQIEFNFMDYIPNDPNYRYSPYVSLGATFFYAPDVSKPFQPAIPFGIGLKYSLSRKISTGIEWSYRKTFTDKLDNLEGIDNITDKQIAYNHDNDWYSYAGIFVAFRFYTKKQGRCPAYGNFYNH